MARRTKPFYQQAVVAQALKMLEDLTKSGPAMGNPDVVADWFRLRLAGNEHEEFGAAFLDSQNRVLGYEVLFRGTLAQTSVYPREIVKAALRWNAAAVIFAHNHPSGAPSPSIADEHLTQTLRSALACIDVRVLDHFVVTTSGSTSFAKLGLI